MFIIIVEIVWALLNKFEEWESRGDCKTWSTDLLRTEQRFSINFRDCREKECDERRLFSSAGKFTTF